MSAITDMLRTSPKDLSGIDQAALATCIDACFECTTICTSCADACLAEYMVADLTTCIRTNLDCADICAATGRVLTRYSGGDSAVVRAALEACLAACTACATECAQHAQMHEHCKICADACRRCDEACTALLATL